MSDTPVSVTGQLLEKDIKKLARASRTSTVGPTALYYAGVTAPMISAGMALMSKNAFGALGFSPYWQLLLSAIFAALAGIVWYLIFMRWSYRHKAGRGNELQSDTQITVEDEIVTLKRGPLEVRVQRSALQKVIDKRGYTIVQFDGVDPWIIPDRWFEKNKAALKAFQMQLRGK